MHLTTSLSDDVCKIQNKLLIANNGNANFAMDAATPVYSARRAGFPGRNFIPSHHSHAGRQSYRPLYKIAWHVRDTGERVREGHQWALDCNAWAVWAVLGRLKSRSRRRKWRFFRTPFQRRETIGGCSLMAASTRK